MSRRRKVFELLSKIKLVYEGVFLKKFITFILSFLLITFTLSGCNKTSFNTEKLYAEAIEKTVEIRSYNTEDKFAYATGCVISKDGKILTNKHVIMSEGEVFQHIEVRFYNSNNFISASIFKISETDDLALIKINKETSNFFNIGHNVKGGEKIFTIGNPNGFGLSFSAGVVSSPLRYVKYNGSEIKTIQTSIVINSGNSGGPLFNNYGELVGLITFRLRTNSGEIIQGVSFALHYSVIDLFLE